jgi:anti-sigma regulatory factor (Ser/Thr protein kinase)
MTFERPSRPDGSMRRWQIMLPKDAPAVRTARDAVERWLKDAPSRSRDDARSVVTELVSNAVRYGRPPIRLTLEQQEDGVRIDVTDAGPQRSTSTKPNRRERWGLRIVDALSDTWGIVEGSSHVWSKLRR